MKKFILMVVAVLGFSFAQAQRVVENYNAATKAVEAKDYVKAAEIASEVDKLNAQLEELYEEWENLQMEIEENGY